MPKIDPNALKACREAKKLTQEKLAEKTKIDVGTISRHERKGGQVRARTIETFARQLGVEPGVLTGELPLPKPSLEETVDYRSLLNIRIRDEARNALTLVGGRYKVSASAIIELAPFLFEWAATTSLKRRQEGIERLEKHIDEAEKIRQTASNHLHPALTGSYRADEILRAEKRSIANRDLFLDWLSLEQEASWDTGGDEILNPHDDEDDRPFVSFLKGLGEQTGGLAEFETWWGGPSYTVCKAEALSLAGGDEKIAASITGGGIPLHEMPKEIRSSSNADERIAWLKMRHAQSMEKLASDFPELAAMTDILVEQPK